MESKFTILMVCIDCMQFVAGFDPHERGDEYPEEVIESFERDSDNVFSNGDADDEIPFSTFPCMQCGSNLAGSRHAIVYYKR